ncbi:hypothetical protein EUX98_g3524 [Antrodiella citrinella]|uniref:Uncharacterized protein n=1 Tax=Antrodiella citrinella TaxID=2447956 RepID=A0A4S4N4H4_9APHY|nr:hypothetical protein EUX98_g3524 [Antrodiella citrinella]
MSFAPSMHGNLTQESNISFMSDVSEDTAAKIATMQAKLNKKLGPEFVSQRPGPGGAMKLTYAEGWKIINLANEVFGFNGWSSNVVSLTTDFIDFNEETKRYTVGVTAVIRVTLRDGVFHEDIGYGALENSKSKGAALDKCKKEAVTDGIKRALRNFGNLLGNCLYDKAYASEVVKMKVPAPKFNKDELYRRPEFDPNNFATPSTLGSSTGVKSEFQAGVMPPPAQRPRPALPSHMRSVTGPARTTTPIKSEPIAGPSRHATPAHRPTENGLNTPRQTPAQVPHPTVVQHQPPNARTSAPPAPAPPAPPPQAAVPAAVPEHNKHVSFAPPPPPVRPPQASEDPYGDDDASILLNSEDDAFFAGIDLGEGDPVPDEGIGGHIDFDEGLGEENEINVNVSVRVPPSPPRVQALERPPPQQQPRPQQQQQPPRRHQTMASTSNSSNSHAPVPEAKPEQTSQRSSAPSMGGFRFPNTNNPQTFSRPQGGSGPGSGIGLKRNVDTMLAQSSTNGPPRPMQGMGLAQQQQHNNNGYAVANGERPRPTGRREPLSTLHSSDGPEGTDPKRVRR